ncbi:MAG: DUF2147 domain-containing protein [Variovorax sp.]
MKKTIAALLLAAITLPAWAQMSPVGIWQTIDDKTDKPKSLIRIIEGANGLSGKIEKLLREGAPADARCIECSDDRKGLPMVGLEIVRGGKKAEGKDLWEGGKILDPENGKEYRAGYTPVDGGKKLEVRGYLGPFWRTQTWHRVP